MKLCSLDYNINWGDYFYEDASSPSGLRYKNKTSRKAKDSAAGTLSFQKTTRYTHCWLIHFRQKCYSVHRILWVMRNGSLSNDVVIDHLNGDPCDNSIGNLAIKTFKENLQNQKKYTNNRTGITGVYKSQGYYIAQWVDPLAGTSRKLFSIHKLGDIEALQLATNYRKEQIDSLNNIGMCYTERHGT